MEPNHTLWEEFKWTFHRVGFWALVIFLMGMSAGGFSMYKLFEWRMKEAKEIHYFVFDKKVYEMRERGIEK